MHWIRFVTACLTILLAWPEFAHAAPNPQTEAIERAGILAAQHASDQALQILNPIIADLEKKAAEARSKGLVFCASSEAESLAYLMTAAAKKTSAVVLGPALCSALFYKGYALGDLGQKAEAVSTLEELTALAPLHGHYFVELGYAYRLDGQPDKARKAYQQAIDSPALGDDPASATRDVAAAYRGQGYLLVDQGKLSDAEKAYRKSLEYDSDSKIAKSELEYIKSKQSN